MAMPGIIDVQRRNAFVEQLLASQHRVVYVSVIKDREISRLRADPNDELFDPLKAAILAHRDGDSEEAYWLIFLFVHFGKHSRGGFRYVREIYGHLGGPDRWNWQSVSGDPAGFCSWLDANKEHLSRKGAGFGNHRKYESLDALSSGGTGAVVKSYVRWVSPPRTHRQIIDEAFAAADGDARGAFRQLFSSMESVKRFGRTARFDYLAMLGKLGLADIVPDAAYLKGATGPLSGAKLLFGDDESAAVLEGRIDELDKHLSVGMQVIEDALCNWQKSPGVFVPFRG